MAEESSNYTYMGEHNTMKKLILATIIGMMMLMLAGSASALVDVTYTANVNNFEVEAYDCLDASCSQVSTFSGSFPNGKTTTNGQVVIRYPSSLATSHGYAVYYVSDGQVPQEYSATWHSNGDPTVYTAGFGISFYQLNSCSAVIDSFSVTNDAQANIPLVISTSSSMDATTHSAFQATSNGIEYVPSQFKEEHYSSDIDVQLKVYKNNNLVESQTQSYKASTSNAVFMDDSVSTEFSWIPTTSGEYTATVTTTVTDSQCASNQAQSSSKDFNVLSSTPSDSYYTLLNDLAVDDVRPQPGETVTVTFNKISNYADGNGALTAVATDVTYKVTGPNGTYLSESSQLAANSDSVSASSHSFSFIANDEGDYTVTVTGEADESMGSADNEAETVTLTLTATKEGPFDAIFQLRDSFSGANIVGASVSVAGKSASSDATGTATVEDLESGDYTYTITHPDYQTLTGSLTVTDYNINLLLVMVPVEPGTGEGSHSITASVVDKDSGDEIEGATVSIGGKTGTSDSNGVVTLTGFADGTYSVFASADDYKDINGVVTVNGEDVSIVIEMEATSAKTSSEGSEAQFGLHISSIRMPGQFDMQSGDMMQMHLSFSNSGNRGLDDVKAAVVVQDLGIRGSVGPFDLSAGSKVSKAMYVELPEDAEFGTYYARVTIHSSDATRVVHREFDITN